MKVIIIAGSVADSDHVTIIQQELKTNGILDISEHYLSAHKNIDKLLTLIRTSEKHTIFITVAGLSNALSGVVAANTISPVIACPPFQSPTDYLIDIHSTLRMPSEVPVLTVLDRSRKPRGIWFA